MSAAGAPVVAAAACSLDAEGSPGRFGLAGVLTLQTVAALRIAGRSAFAAQSTDLTVNLHGVTRAESAGLALLVDWLAWAATNGRALRYEALPEALLSLARLSGVDELLTTGVGGHP
jgi:phospholipid transport system transporter-binding protein